MNYLLDTCTFLWLTNKPQMLSESAKSLINDPVNVLYLSDVSVWEISLKVVAGKLPLPHSIRAWIPQQRALHQIHQLSLVESAIYTSADLPTAHRDPFDRMLAAQCLDSGMTLLSPDSAVDSLGAKRVW